MTDLTYLSATEAMAQFAAGTLSPVELMQAVVARAEAVEPTINAFTYKYFDEAMDAARASEARWAKGAPLGTIISHMRTDLGVRITPETLTATPILSLLRDAGLHIGGATQTIEAMNADPELASMLQVEPRAAVLHVERKIENDDGEPILVTNAYYRADRYRLSFDMHETGQFVPEFG